MVRCYGGEVSLDEEEVRAAADDHVQKDSEKFPPSRSIDSLELGDHKV